VIVDNSAPADSTPPTVSVTSPSAGSTVSGTVNVTASASDNVGVASVQIMLDGQQLGAPDATTPYAVAWDTRTATAGTHRLTAVAKDAAGNSTTSATVTVIVDNSAPADSTPPTVSVTSPSAGSTVSGTVNVAASASDNVGVAGVQFTLDGQSLGAEDTAAPYSSSWNTATASSGTHVVGAVARDAAGNTTSATTVSVTVSNAQPTVLLGDQSVESGTDSDGAGTAEAFSASAAASGTISTLKVYVDSGSSASKLVVGIYASSGSHPGALLTQGTVTAPTAGAWNAVSVPAASLTAGVTYWIAVLSPSGAGTVRFRDTSSGTACETSSQTTLAALPSTWSTGASYRNAPLSAYGG
jgi:Bacterial Ig domain